ncbi:MAG: MarR family transcriptional regulator [Ruminococcus sp.]|nr:MarR family transcriptional regulator [Ruminococcus sp.]
MKDNSWIDMMEKMQDIRLFANLNVRRIEKGSIISSQELDMLSRIGFSDVPRMPLELAEQTGLKKSAVSRLIENLEKKEFIIKEYSLKDKRSYTLKITEKGSQALEQTCRYYLEPIYELRNALGEKRFEALTAQIKEADNVLQNRRQTK